MGENLTIHFAAYTVLYNESKRYYMMTTVGVMVFYFILFWLLVPLMEKYAYRKWGKNAKSTWVHYLNLSQEKKYYYISYITSTLNSFQCLFLFVLGNGNCDPPKELRRDDVILGNTFVRN